MTDIIKSQVNQMTIIDVQSLAAKRDEYLEQSTAANTRRAYVGDMKVFTAFCNAIGQPSIPASPDTVSMYVSYLAEQGKKVATIRRHLSTISTAHKTSNLPTPTTTMIVRKAMDGIANNHSSAPAAKKAAVVDDIKLMVEQIDTSKLIGIRDRALLLIGFAGALRRSELVGLDVDDIETTSDGLIITIRHSKTDQEGMGQRIGVGYAMNQETCPVRAYEAWLAVSGIDEGAVFRNINKGGKVGTRLSGFSVAQVVKRYAEAVGLNPDDYAGHSLRSGFATTGARNGMSERSIMKQTRHTSVEMVRRYIHEGELFTEEYSQKLGL